MAYLLFIDKENLLYIGTKLWVEKDTNEAICHVEVNLSNDDFQPGKVSRKVSKHFIGMVPLTNVPAFVAASSPAIP